MTRTRVSKRCDAWVWASLLLTGLGCAAPQEPQSAVATRVTESEAETPPRKPDGVVLEPPTAMPSAAARAEARGVVTLREPLAEEALRQCITTILDAWQHESIERLRELLTTDAGPLDSRSGGRKALEDSWRQRMHIHEYEHLAGLELVRFERVQRWDWDALGQPDAPERPAGMQPGELYVRVPLEVTVVAGEKLFDDEMVLLLRPEGAHFRVAAYGEQSR